MNSLIKIGYAFLIFLCFGLSLGAKAQGLPAIDLPPLPGADAPANGLPGLPGLPPLPGAIPAVAPDAIIETAAPALPAITQEDVILPTIEVDAELPTLPAIDVTAAQPELPAAIEEAAPPAIEELPLLAGDDPFADPEFDALFQQDTPATPKIIEESPAEPVPSQEDVASGAPALPALPGVIPPLPLPDAQGEAKPDVKTVELPSEKETKPAKKKTHKVVRKQPFNYKVQRLPSPVAQRSYPPGNRHLPVVRYEDDLDHSVFLAAATNNVNGLRALLNAGRRINMVNPQGDTALITAIRAGAMKTARLLVARGADVNLRNRFGQGAIDVARQQRNQVALALLSPVVFAQR